MQMTVDAIAEKVSWGERIGADEALTLYREASTWQLGRLADAIRAQDAAAAAAAMQRHIELVSDVALLK